MINSTIEVKFKDYKQRKELIKYLNERDMVFNIKNNMTNQEYQDLMKDNEEQNN